jgi:hypothetical protein
MTRSRLNIFLSTFIAGVPAVVLGCLIARYWVNVPLFDEWDTPGRLFKEVFIEGRFQLATLFAQHNESRPVVPKLVWLGLASLFGWDTKINQALGWLVALATFACWVILMRRTSNGWSPRTAVGVIIISLLFFSTNQWEHWLWGISLMIFLPGLCLSACLVVHHSKMTYPQKVCVCAALALVSTYSNANGMLCWILGWPVPTSDANLARETKGAPRRRMILTVTAVYLTLMLGALFAYFYNYTRPPHHPGTTGALTHPLAALRYLMEWLGNPLARGTRVEPELQATIAGGVALAYVLWIFLASWFQRFSLFHGGGWRRYHPWFVLALYALASGVITTLGRFGFEQATATRYISFSVYLFIGIVGLTACAKPAPLLGSRIPLARSAELALVIVLLLVCFAGWVEGRRAFESHCRSEEQLRLTLRFLPLIPDNPQLNDLYPRPELLREIALPLLSHHVLRANVVGSWLQPKLRQPDGADPGMFFARTADTSITVNGWTMVPEERFLPDCIVITAGDSEDQLLITALTLPGIERPPSKGTFLGREFSVTLPLRAGLTARAIHAYSVDLSKHAIFAIKAE